jgi:MFS family permease
MSEEFVEFLNRCAVPVTDSGVSTAIMSAPDAAMTPSWTLYSSRQRWGLLAVLFLVSTSNYLDRNVISVLLEPIKQEFHVSDTMLGLLGGFCFSIFYAVFGMPVARWADRGNRRTVITLALAIWSLMTLCCGLAQTFVQLTIARIGVGAGEAGAIPPAQSLIADYFSPQQRATAIAIFPRLRRLAICWGSVSGATLRQSMAGGWRFSWRVRRDFCSP